LSPLLNSTSWRTPPTGLAVASLALPSTSLIAAWRAVFAEMPGAAAAEGAVATGEPTTLISWPRFVTFACTPLPKNGIPPTVWM